MIGRTLAHYRITAALGAGGMGEVCRATDKNLNRDVAIKVLPPEVAKDQERLSRFRREAHLLASLNHPNIAAICGLEEADGKPFLALELVEGEDLKQRLLKGAIPVDEALEIAEQIAEALEEAHSKGIVHRDRAAYFDGIPRENLDDAVVFLDPDNGLEVKSTGDGNGDRYVTYDDVEAIYSRMGNDSVLVIYQHLPRVHRRLFLYSTFGRLVEKLRCPIPVSISDNQIAFLILAKAKERQREAGKALHEYTRSHLEIYD